MAAIASAVRSPPSSLTACAPPSFTSRPAFLQCLRRSELEGHERQVGYDHRPLRSTGNATCVVDHLVERDRQRCRMPLHHHAERIAHENRIDAGLVQQAGERIVVCRQDRQANAARPGRTRKSGTVTGLGLIGGRLMGLPFRGHSSGPLRQICRVGRVCRVGQAFGAHQPPRSGLAKPRPTLQIN